VRHRHLRRQRSRPRQVIALEGALESQSGREVTSMRIFCCASCAGQMGETALRDRA